MAAKANKLPTECVPGLRDELDPWVIYCIDTAVMTFHGVVDSALHEMQSFGGKTTGEPKYSLDQLLDEEFRLPRPLSLKDKKAATGGAVKAMVGQAQAQKARVDGVKSTPRLPANLLRQLKEKGIVA